ncbi:MAG: hypothetical protein WC375_11010 [Methanomassiliicoccales archaeon]|jgi:hypothetical protein
MGDSWYKRAKQEKKPYKVVVIKQDGEYDVQSLKGVRIDAFSSEQARKFFLDKYPLLSDYLGMGYAVEARFDKALWDVRETARKSKKDSRDQQIRDAWWQN